MGDRGWFTIRETTAGEYYFVLAISHDEVIATSGVYTTKASALQGIDSVKRAVATARTLDLTD